ncbi:MAG TPA: apolipoprotein N-acyltransferase [Acidimicrobiales bacterium]|nr:apolipoprotein N-acyltransferase [Acidimicrobiales bacterium]
MLAHSLVGTAARGRFLRGWCFGLGQFAVGLVFILEFSAVGYGALIAAEALFPALAAVAAGRRGSPWALAGALAIGEWLRAMLPFGGLPPGGLPLAAVGSPAFALARLGGPVLLSFVFALAGGALARLAAGGGRGVRPASGLLVGICLLCLLAALAPEGGVDGPLLRAAAVQGGGPRGLHQEAQPGLSAFARSEAESFAVRGRVALLLWPEDTVPLPRLPATSTALGTTLGAVARSLATTILAGVTVPVGGRHFLNEELAFAPNGRVTGAVEKTHAVPFGEYVPWRGLLGRFFSLRAVPFDALVGHGHGVLDVAGTRVGVLISFETFFPGRGREEARAGAELLVVPTNTASYASRQLPAEELAATRLQAVASGRYVLQAATTGYSAFVLPSGAVRGVTRLDAISAVVVNLPTRRGLTLYDQGGDLPWLVLGALAVVLAEASRRARPLALRRSSG